MSPNTISLFKKILRLTSAIAAFSIISVMCFNLFKEKKSAVKINSSKINTVVAALGVKPISYQINAEKGDTINYHSGTQIIIPAACFVDEKGNKISGMVDLEYREYTNTAEILLSGIPMTYDSAGVQNNFESAGMLEINAYQNQKPVFINAAKAIHVDMASTLEKPGINLYRFDSIKNNWTMLGKDSLNNSLADNAEAFFIDNKNNFKNDPLCASAKNLIEKKQTAKKLLQIVPVKPVLANTNKSSFTIDFDKEEFAELSEFENVQFEICDEKTNIGNADTAIIWEHVSIKKTISNQYLVTFNSGEQKLKYNVIPVFDKMNIEKAKLIFEAKYNAYNKKLEENKMAIAMAQKKLEDELKKAQQELALAREMEMQKEKEMQEIARTKAIEIAKELAEQTKKQQQAYADQQAQMMKQVQLQREANLRAKQKAISMGSALNAVTRSFELNEFGIYNCDRVFAMAFKNYKIKVKLNTNDNSQIVALYMIYKDMRGAINCYPLDNTNSYDIKYNKKDESKIVAVLDTKKMGVCENAELARSLQTEEKEISLNVTPVNFNNQSEILSLINFNN